MATRPDEIKNDEFNFSGDAQPIDVKSISESGTDELMSQVSYNTDHSVTMTSIEEQKEAKQRMDEVDALLEMNRREVEEKNRRERLEDAQRQLNASAQQPSLPAQQPAPAPVQQPRPLLPILNTPQYLRTESGA